MAAASKLKELKVNLSLLKKFVIELEESLKIADAIKASEASSKVEDYVVEMSKAIGLASGAAAEASMLVKDIQTCVAAQSLVAAADAEIAAELGTKGSKGGAN